MIQEKVVMNNIRNISKEKLTLNMLISTICKPISMVISYIYVPIVLNYLGAEKYGIWSTILTILSWISYFDIGIGNGLRNRLTEAIAKDDKQNAQIFISTAYLGSAVMAGVFFILLVVCWHFMGLTDFFNLNVDDENIDIIIFISLFFVCVNFVLALSKTSAYAIQQSSLNSIMGVIGHILQIIVLFGLSKFFHESLLAVALMYGLISLIDNLLLFLQLFYIL